jgi:RNA polymerase sigma factor (sigma-70 family)
MAPAAEMPLDADVLAAANGDRGAFARLVSATSALVTSIALAEVRDVDASYDVAQDVYLHMWNDLGRLRDPGSFLPWLRQIARRQARRLATSRARQVRGREADRAVDAEPAPGPGPADALLDAERTRAVRDALDELPDDARETLLLYYREGHSAAQVARLLGVQEAAVHQRLSRARARVRADVLARLGDALADSAPGAAFTAAVLTSLAPRAATAAVPAAAGLLAKLGGAPAAGLGAAALALVLAVAIAVGGAGRATTPPPPTVGRPAGIEALAERGPATPRLALEHGTGALAISVTAGGRPVSGAHVRAYALFPVEPGTGRPAWRLVAERDTDAAGGVRVAADVGAYLVSARAHGLAPAQAQIVRAAGEPETHVALTLLPPVGFSGRTVARTSGDPVPLVALALARETSLEQRQAIVPMEERAAATSDPHGRFSFSGLAPGRYTLEAEAPGHGRVRLTGVYVPESEPLTMELSAAGLIEGVVRASNGAPAAGAEVRFAGGQDILVVETGPSGGFAAEVEPGPYRVSARRGNEAAALPGVVAVASGKAAPGIELRLGKAASLVGAVRTRAGGGLPAALLSLAPCKAQGELARAVSGPDGRYEMTPLTPGVYDLRVSADGFTPVVRTGVTVLAGLPFDLDVAMDGTGAVAGIVTDSSGHPVAGARVRGGQRWGAGLGDVEAETVVGPDGRYRLEGLAQGMATLRVRAAGAQLGPTRDVAIASGQLATADFVLPGVGTLEVVVRGRDDAGATGAVRVKVSSASGSVSEVVDLPVNGERRVHADVPAGPYEVIAVLTDGIRKRCVTAREPVRVEFGSTAHVALRLSSREERPGALTIRVNEPGGAPSRGAMAFVTSGAARAFVSANEEGVVEFTRFDTSDTVTVAARNEGRVAGPRRVAPEARTVDLELSPSVVLRGRVVSGDGHAAEGFRLTLDVPSEVSIGGGVVREFSGDRYEVLDAPSGRVMLTVFGRDGRVGSATLDLAPGQVVERDIVLAPPARVSVRVVDWDGRPIPDSYLRFGARRIDWDPESATPSGSQAQAGWLTATPVAPGPITLLIGARGYREQVRELRVGPGEALDLGDVPLEAVTVSPAR